KNHLKKFVLLALNACDGLPMPQGALIGAVQNLARPGQPTQADVLDAIGAVEADGYVSGASDDMEETTWTLTNKGVHKARQL
ncbi:MAG: hypothetical protein KGH75_12275, partial [Rhodospirillales bacterium]|nr:hypothetical protein [Rhodospirillales bacterium]